MSSSKRIGIIAYNIVTKCFGDASGNMGFITFHDWLVL